MEITIENANKIKKKAEQEHRNISDTINLILKEYFEKLEFISEFLPYLEIDVVTPGEAIIKDRSEKKLVDVKFDGEHLTCQEHISDNCEHTQFVWMSFELAKIKKQ
jgi:hypothetical protein